VAQAGILVVMHGSDSGYARHVNEWTGADAEMLPFKSGTPVAFRLLQATRPAEDAVSALVCDGVLSRFPNLKVAVVELGSSWMGPLLDRMRDVYKKVPQDFAENPVDVVRRNIYICGFWEDDYGALAELIGEEHVLFGSDFPHPEGLAQPASFIEDLSHLPEETVRNMMGGNLAQLFTRANASCARSSSNASMPLERGTSHAHSPCLYSLVHRSGCISSRTAAPCCHGSFRRLGSRSCTSVAGGVERAAVVHACHGSRERSD
jgi:hypothetical protein